MRSILLANLTGSKIILHVITSIASGGAENHLFTLAQQQVNEGLRVAVACLRDGDSRLKTAFEECGVAVMPLGLGCYGQWGPVRRLRSVLTELQPDLIHAHLPPAELYVRLALLDRTYAKVPLVISKHNDERFAPVFFERSLARWVARRAQHMIYISHAVKNFWRKRRVPADPAKACVVHYGLDAAPLVDGEDLRREWGVDPSAVLFGFVGRLVPQKALDNLVTAFARLENPAARLVLVGDGPLKARLEQQVRSLGVAERVQMVGFREDIPAVMAALDVLILGSDYEGFGLVLLEAMAGGKPVLATRVSAIPEIVVDGETGLLVPARNPEAMAKGMARLMDLPLRARLGQAGAERLRREFSPLEMHRKTLAVYRPFLERSALASG